MAHQYIHSFSSLFSTLFLSSFHGWKMSDTDVLNVVDIGSNSFDRNSHPNYGGYDDVFFFK